MQIVNVVVFCLTIPIHNDVAQEPTADAVGPGSVVAPVSSNKVPVASSSSSIRVIDLKRGSAAVAVVAMLSWI